MAIVDDDDDDDQEDEDKVLDVSGQSPPLVPRSHTGHAIPLASATTFFIMIVLLSCDDQDQDQDQNQNHSRHAMPC